MVLVAPTPQEVRDTRLRPHEYIAKNLAWFPDSELVKKIQAKRKELGYAQYDNTRLAMRVTKGEKGTGTIQFIDDTTKTERKDGRDQDEVVSSE